jgi:hypothetical protein
MRYILLIHAEEEVWTQFDERAQADQMNRHEELERDLRRAGKYVDCGGLATTNTATTVRHKEGEIFITDGPYAEAREQLGGYYLVDAQDLDDAIAIARRIPVTANGAVEIRKIEVGPSAG